MVTTGVFGIEGMITICVTMAIDNSIKSESGYQKVNQDQGQQNYQNMNLQHAINDWLKIAGYLEENVLLGKVLEQMNTL